MELESRDLVEMMKAIPVMQAEVTGLKSSLSSLERGIDEITKSVSLMKSNVSQADVKIDELSTLRHSLNAVQEAVQRVGDKLQDMADKYRDVLDAIKTNGRNIEDNHYQLMRTIYNIENAAKEGLNKHESEGAHLHSISEKIDAMSKHEVSVAKTVANGSGQSETMFERIVKVAPNFIAILTFLGYIIYTLIEHKLMGKM